VFANEMSDGNCNSDGRSVIEANVKMVRSQHYARWNIEASYPSKAIFNAAPATATEYDFF